MKKCSICKREYEGFGNNADPVNGGRCCDFCNTTVVIPARLTLMSIGKQEENKIFCDKCGDTGIIEVMGDGPNFEWDVIATKLCECQKQD